MFDPIEELGIEIEEDFDSIEKAFGVNVLPYPACTLGESRIYFNRAAMDYMPSTEEISYFISPNWVVIKAGCGKQKNRWKLYDRKDKKCFLAQFPVALRREKGVKPGCYKLYKYKNGLAFNRYEPIKPNGGE